MQNEPPAPVPAPNPGLKLSSVVLVAIAAIGGVLLGSIYAFILLTAGALTSQLWWMGLWSAIFALGFLLLFAMTSDRRIVRPLAGAFFLISAGSFYGSILTAPEDGLRFVWFVILSILVVAALGGIFVMARQGEADRVRRAQRRVIP